MPSSGIEERVWKLEAAMAAQAKELAEAMEELAAEQGEREKLAERLDYYDKMALKWGWFIMGILALAAMIAAGVDKLKDKLIDRVLPWGS